MNRDRLERPRLARAAALLVLVAAGVYLARVALWEPLPLVGEAIDDDFARAKGVVHVHTTLSDGSGTPESVIAAAGAAGLDFIVLTDHNNLGALAYDGDHDGTLVVVGSELSTTAGHLLGLGLDRDPDYRFSGDAMDGLADVRELGGVPFAAHPLSPARIWRGRIGTCPDRGASRS